MPLDHQSRVTYLIGAGGSHANVKAVGSSRGMLMSDLTNHLVGEVRSLVSSHVEYQQLTGVVNEIIGDDADFEHVITFFDESPSALHRDFADELRRIFEKVLSEQLTHIERELGTDRVALYSALLDMYNIDGFDERLQGILTLNYDEYIEAAAEAVGEHVDFGIAADDGTDNRLSLLKLHGSFGWQDVWPIRQRSNSEHRPLWIPPGIRKAKDRYPFNLLWGLAREMLNCDILRIVGCRLGPNDWDLISLLFSTRHSNLGQKQPYLVEVIDSPEHAEDLKRRYPYLDVQSILEIEKLDIGKSFVSEFVGGAPRRFVDLSAQEVKLLEMKTSATGTTNWFRMWLVQMCEGLHRELGSKGTATPSGTFRKWLEV